MSSKNLSTSETRGEFVDIEILHVPSGGEGLGVSPSIEYWAMEGKGKFVVRIISTADRLVAIEKKKKKEFELPPMIEFLFPIFVVGDDSR